MLLNKILVLSSYLPSLNHCIFYLTFPCHGACLFCQYWTTGTRTLPCPRTSPRTQWPTGLHWDLPISYAWSTRPPSSCWVMGCTWRPLVEDILPVTFSLCSHTSLQAQCYITGTSHALWSSLESKRALIHVLAHVLSYRMLPMWELVGTGSEKEI